MEKFVKSLQVNIFGGFQPFETTVRHDLLKKKNLNMLKLDTICAPQRKKAQLTIENDYPRETREEKEK